MYRIRRFGIVKTATTVAVLYMVIVAIFVVPFLVLAAIAGTGMASGDTSFNVGGVLAVGLAAIFLYGLLGWVITAIACAFYNLVAGWIGGVEIQLEAVVTPPPVPAWGPPATPPAPPPPSGVSPAG
jgi:hypothetical protein